MTAIRTQRTDLIIEQKVCRSLFTKLWTLRPGSLPQPRFVPPNRPQVAAPPTGHSSPCHHPFPLPRHSLSAWVATPPPGYHCPNLGITAPPPRSLPFPLRPLFLGRHPPVGCVPRLSLPLPRSVPLPLGAPVPGSSPPPRAPGSVRCVPSSVTALTMVMP